MAWLVLSFLELILLAVLGYSHKVVDDIEIIVDNVATGHDVLAVKEGRVVNVGG